MQIVWAVAFVVFVIIEAATVGLASIWFAIGALAAFICAWAGGAIWLQVLWFTVISILMLLLTRPLAKKLETKKQPTNADRVIGTTGVVREKIDGIAGTGSVYIGKRLWSARSVDGSIIEVDEIVKAESIEGVKLLVQRETADNVQQENINIHQ
jgi:membrane protein implicated in regulation of membrane protease activity